MGSSNTHISSAVRTCTFSPSGSYLRLKLTTGEGTQVKGGIRGKVQGFSAGARGRMFQKVAQVPNKLLSEALFVTLTYPRDYPHEATTWKRHLDAFGQRLRKLFHGISLIWKLEPQKRGAPHFHLLVFNHRFLPISVLSREWWLIAGHGDPNHARNGVDVDRVKKARNAMAYVGKYIAKVPERTDRQTGEIYEWDYPGRWWGVIGRDDLPADIQQFALPGEAWYYVKRQLARYMESRGRPGYFGGDGGGWVLLDGQRTRKLLSLAGVT